MMRFEVVTCRRRYVVGVGEVIGQRQRMKVQHDNSFFSAWDEIL